MSAVIQFLCRISGKIVYGANGADYEGGKKKLLMVSGDTNYEQLIVEIGSCFGIDLCIHEVTVSQRMGQTKNDGTTKWTVIPIDDDGDLQNAMFYCRCDGPRDIFYELYAEVHENRQPQTLLISSSYQHQAPPSFTPPENLTPLPSSYPTHQTQNITNTSLILNAPPEDETHLHTQDHSSYPTPVVDPLEHGIGDELGHFDDDGDFREDFEEDEMEFGSDSSNDDDDGGDGDDNDGADDATQTDVATAVVTTTTGDGDASLVHPYPFYNATSASSSSTSAPTATMAPPMPPEMSIPPEMQTMMDSILQQQQRMEQRFGGMEQRFGDMEQQFGDVQQQFGDVQQHQVRMERHIDDIRQTQEHLQAEQTSLHATQTTLTERLERSDAFQRETAQFMVEASARQSEAARLMADSSAHQAQTSQLLQMLMAQIGTRPPPPPPPQ